MPHLATFFFFLEATHGIGWVPLRVGVFRAAGWAFCGLEGGLLAFVLLLFLSVRHGVCLGLPPPFFFLCLVLRTGLAVVAHHICFFCFFGWRAGGTGQCTLGYGLVLLRVVGDG